MKQLLVILSVFFSITLTVNAQKTLVNQTFENLEKGEDILKLQKEKYKTWGKSTWTVTEKKGKGFEKSNKFVSSGDEENANLVQYKNLEVGETYVFSVAVKMTNTGKQGWKSNYAVKATSGNKGDTHVYKVDDMKEPGANKWKQHKLEFTVIEGRERLALQVYRWAPNTTLNVDNFKLVKK